MANTTSATAQGRRVRRGAWPVLLVAVLLVALTACDPVLHPDVVAVAPAEGALRLVMVSADGTGALVYAAAIDGAYTSTGMWHLDRVTGVATKTPAGSGPSMRISDDGDRVRYSNGSQSFVWTPQTGAQRQVPATTTLTPNLRYGSVLSVLPAGTTVLVWSSATGTSASSEWYVPRPAEYPTFGEVYGVSDDGSVVWFKLYGPTGCIARVIDLDLRQGYNVDLPCEATFQVSSNGETLVRLMDHIEVYDPDRRTIGGPTKLELVDVRSGETRRTVTPTVEGAWFDGVVQARTGWNLWTVETSVSPGTTACTPELPSSCETSTSARALVVASSDQHATYPVDPGLYRYNTNSTVAFSTEEGGRFLVYASTAEASVHVVDRLTATDEVIAPPDGTPGVGVGAARITDDGLVVSFTARVEEGATDIARSRGWFEARTAP